MDASAGGGARASLAATRNEGLVVLLIVTLLVVGRSLVFVIFEHAQFDADQAITGLMAKHIAELRAFPFYAYASDYVLVVEAWLAAPFLALFGTSVAALDYPSSCSTWSLASCSSQSSDVSCTFDRRCADSSIVLRRSTAVLAAELLTATGGNVEPFVYVLLLWLTRERPVAFGIIFLVGFMNREFTAYAASALLLVEALQGRLWQIDNLRQKAVVLGWSRRDGCSWAIANGRRRNGTWHRRDVRPGRLECLGGRRLLVPEPRPLTHGRQSHVVGDDPDGDAPRGRPRSG